MERTVTKPMLLGQNTQSRSSAGGARSMRGEYFVEKRCECVQIIKFSTSCTVNPEVFTVSVGIG